MGNFEWAVKQSRVPAGGVRREFIVPKGEDLNPNLLPVIGDIFVLSDGRRCLANEADESLSNNGKQRKASREFLITPNVPSASLALLFHRTSTRARLNL